MRSTCSGVRTSIGAQGTLSRGSGASEGPLERCGRPRSRRRDGAGAWLMAQRPGTMGGLSHPCYTGAVLHRPAAPDTGGSRHRRLPALTREPNGVSERLQEFNDRLLIRLTQLLEVARDIARPAAMAEDRFAEGERGAIVPQHGMGAHAPEGRGAQAVGA